ncbi:hypothetical protein CRQ34_13840 [Salmonella enterica subsp. enterica serovar Livingstone]|nr:hypothetical protein [Salmonella enterica subsp. enterica serovar Livingstone]
MSTGLRFTLEVDGLPPDVFAVVSFHLSQSYSSLFTLDISLVSQQLHSIEFSQILEKMAYLKIWQGNETEGSDWFVPDGLWGVNFMDVCRNHDKCYATKGSDKTTCDVNLGNDIALACGVLKSEDPRYNDIYTQCLITSAAYRVAVGTFGKGAYNDAQAGAE